MVARIAYWIRNATSDLDVLQGPATARIRAGLPVRASDPADSLMSIGHPQGGRMLVWPRYDGGAVGLDAFAEPRTTDEGWAYYPSKEPFDLMTLIRPEIERPIDGQWITTSKGVELWVAVAILAQRDLILRANRTIDHGGYSGEFGTLGHELYDQYYSKEGITDHAKLVRLVQLTIQQSYWMTEEMIEDESPRWFQSRDMGLVLYTLMGQDPKGYAVAPAPSASSMEVAG